MRRAVETLGRAAFDWTDCSSPHVRQGSSASSVTSAFGAPTETKKALYVVALSRVRRLRSGLDPVLTPVTGLPSPEPPLAALAKPARNHRHVRNWARTHVLCVAPFCKTLRLENPFVTTISCGVPLGRHLGRRRPEPPPSPQPTSAKGVAKAALVQPEEFDCPPTGNYT